MSEPMSELMIEPIDLSNLPPELSVCANNTQQVNCTPADQVPDYSQFELILPDNVRAAMKKYEWSISNYQVSGVGISSRPFQLIYGATLDVQDDNQLVEFKLTDVPHIIILSYTEFDGDSGSMKIDLTNGAIELIDSLASPPLLDSAANAPHAIASAILAAEPYIGQNRSWKFYTSEGNTFGAQLDRLMGEVKTLGSLIESMAGLGTDGANQVNKFLKEHGFDIQLETKVNPTGISTASVLDIKVKWRNKGTPSTLHLAENNHEVPAVSMPEIDQAYRVHQHNQPIVAIPTDDGTTVYMTRHDGTFPKTPTAIIDWCKQVSSSLANSNTEMIRGVTFPMVDFNEQGSLDWLLGASTQARDGGSVVITQALYQNRLRMNETGARAESAVALGTTRGLGGPVPLYIDGPFVVWFEKNGIVSYGAYITEKNMRQPDGLD